MKMIKSVRIGRRISDTAMETLKTDEDLDLPTDKGIYPYDYFDDFERFKEGNYLKKRFIAN